MGNRFAKGYPRGNSIFAPKGSYGCLCKGRTHRHHVHIPMGQYREVSVNAQQALCKACELSGFVMQERRILQDVLLEISYCNRKTAKKKGDD